MYELFFYFFQGKITVFVLVILTLFKLLFEFPIWIFTPLPILHLSNISFYLISYMLNIFFSNSLPINRKRTRKKRKGGNELPPLEKGVALRWRSQLPPTEALTQQPTTYRVEVTATPSNRGRRSRNPWPTSTAVEVVAFTNPQMKG
jgi:hypothetical protein